MKMYSFTPQSQKNSTLIPLYHLKQNKKDKTRITGYWKGISQGDIFQFPSVVQGRRYDYFQIEKISYRNHKGIFKNTEDAVNSFFDTECVILADENVLEDVTHINDELLSKN